MNINRKIATGALSIIVACTGVAGLTAPAMATVGNGGYARAARNLTWPMHITPQAMGVMLVPKSDVLSTESGWFTTTGGNTDTPTHLPQMVPAGMHVDC